MQTVRHIEQKGKDMATGTQSTDRGTVKTMCNGHLFLCKSSPQNAIIVLVKNIYCGIHNPPQTHNSVITYRKIKHFYKERSTAMMTHSSLPVKHEMSHINKKDRFMSQW
uniref:Uncharacterized protein n=1 Tax=Anguilla anguilla TaxID=7936 RepID=A0A0E9WCY3_ANGAN